MLVYGDYEREKRHKHYKNWRLTKRYTITTAQREREYEKHREANIEGERKRVLIEQR
jgi:hypothetical protein